MSQFNEQATASLALMDNEQAIQQPSGMGMMAWAAKQGASVEQIAELWKLQLAVEANEAKKAFNLAFSAFKAEAVRVVKNADVKSGPLVGSKYADLFGVVDVVTPALSKHGLSHSWKLTRDEKDWMEVTCTISHSLGHSESYPMGAAPDVGPGRNAIQARGSAKSYLERYTLLAATGLAAAGQDTDGSVAPEGMDDGEFQRYCGLIETASNVEVLKTKYMAAVKDAGTDQGAITTFAKLKDKRWNELKEANASR